MVKPVSDLDKMALNNIHAHHLIYVHWHRGGLCKPYGRLYVNLDESDEFGTFIFRTTGFNSIRTLAARLRYYHAASGDLLSCLPLQLTLRGKSTTQSYRTPIYYVDLTLRDGVNLRKRLLQPNRLMNKARQQGFIRRLWIMWHRVMAMPVLRWVVKRGWILLRSFIR
jgi:hypothetical protein